MKVGVIGPTYPDSLADNLLDCLPDVGVSAVSLGPAGPIAGGKVSRALANALSRTGWEGEEFSQRPLVERARANPCDLIINTQQGLAPKWVKELKATGADVCLWFPDAVSNLGRMALTSEQYDQVFLKDPLLVSRLRDVYGLPVHFLPEACNPRWHLPIGEPGKFEHLVVVGNFYPSRVTLLRRLVRDGVPLMLYGSKIPRWIEPGPLAALHQGHQVTRYEKSQVFREARGVLNNLHPAEMESFNCRIFEATAAGGAVLTERRADLDSLFESTEVLGFSSYEELLGGARLLLGDAGLSTAVGDAASRRARSEHTYQARIFGILEAFK